MSKRSKKSISSRVKYERIAIDTRNSFYIGRFADTLKFISFA